jgi:hypothetical protein
VDYHIYRLHKLVKSLEKVTPKSPENTNDPEKIQPGEDLDTKRQKLSRGICREAEFNKRTMERDTKCNPTLQSRLSDKGLVMYITRVQPATSLNTNSSCEYVNMDTTEAGPSTGSQDPESSRIPTYINTQGRKRRTAVINPYENVQQ